MRKPGRVGLGERAGPPTTAPGGDLLAFELSTTGYISEPLVSLGGGTAVSGGVVVMGEDRWAEGVPDAFTEAYQTPSQRSVR